MQPQNTNVDMNIIKPEQIPNIDLYMDQVTTFVDEMLSSYKRIESDKVLTKTMINNYTKDKIIPPPIKKRYTRRHIILLILVYHLKYIFSIQDIKILLEPLNKYDDLAIEEFYKFFTIMQETGYKTAVENDKNLEMLMEVMDFTLQANGKKQAAEKIIDNYFNVKK